MARYGSEKSMGQVLIVGDVDRAFLAADDFSALPCRIETDLFDGIDIAAETDFATIAVVISGAASQLKSVLKSLKEANSKARIILLSQMYEEPLARKLVSYASNGQTLANDYVICPVRARAFYESLSRPGPAKAAPVTLRVVDAATDRRIQRLEHLATTDELTGLKNRRYLWEFGRQIIEYAKGTSGQVTLLVFDIDDFKHYNDEYGHPVGDEILKQAAELMRRCCREHDVVGRIGGDEFAVIFWDEPHDKGSKQRDERRSASADHPKEAVFIANRLRSELKKAELNYLGPKGAGLLTISGGLASFPRDGSTVQKLFQQADNALLEAKRSGKNRIYLVGQPQDNIDSGD